MDPGNRRAVESERSRWRGTPVLIERINSVASGSTNRCFRLHCKGGRLSPSAMARTAIVPGILLEHLDISAGAYAAEGLGTRPAVLHRHRAERVGWNRDNTIGASPRPNARREDWIGFLRRDRVGFPLDLAGCNGQCPLQQESAARPLDRQPSLFSRYRPQPPLLHGDLWSGNAGALRHGEAVIFDPDVYFGDRKTDLSTTELFGGLPLASC